jgi:hypothetical protein
MWEVFPTVASGLRILCACACDVCVHMCTCSEGLPLSLYTFISSPLLPSAEPLLKSRRPPCSLTHPLVIPSVEIGLHHQIHIVVSCPVHGPFPDERDGCQVDLVADQRGHASRSHQRLAHWMHYDNYDMAISCAPVDHAPHQDRPHNFTRQGPFDCKHDQSGNSDIWVRAP